MNSRFPSLALFSRHFKSSRGLRAALVLALIAVVSSLPFYSFAQGDRVSIKKSKAYSLVPNKGSFVLHAGPNGETLCRQATPAELQAIRGGHSGEANGLVQINHLKNESSSESPTAGLKIVLRATMQLHNNHPQAEQAFIVAAAKWEALIKDPITILVDVDFGDTFFGQPFTGSDVIGATESDLFSYPNNYSDIKDKLINHSNESSVERDLANALPNASVPTDLGSVNTVLAPSPLLRALGAIPIDYTTDQPNDAWVDPPRIGFNSAFGFDFDPSDDITGNRTDFDAVAVHEIGHLLGFDSAVGYREVEPSSDLALTVWDLFRFSPGTANLGTFGSASRILSSGASPSVQHVQFNGGPELGLSTGKPDGTGGDEEQASHWKADEQSGTYLGIMDPTISRNTREVMTANDQSTIDSIGYRITATTPPPNDNFANAQIVTGNSGTVTGTNAFSTKETGEPNHDPGDFPSGKSIWYRWTAPHSGTVTITTAGSNYDTLLAVYNGSAVNALAFPAEALAPNQEYSNDDENNPSILTSRIRFPAVAGRTYQIAVDGYGGDQGSVRLNWNLPSTVPNTVQFTVSTASVTETPNATASVDLTITRTGTTTGAATVDYTTSDGTANDRSDYVAALGTLRFAANETTKTITLLIVDDSYGENPETFNLTLNSSLGCNIGTPGAVVITINSNSGETVPGTNGPNPVKDPNFSSDFFVRQHYYDFLNRIPDDSGLAFWKNDIDQCELLPPADRQGCREIKRINVSAAFFRSIEFQETGFLVERLYKTAYGDFTGQSTCCQPGTPVHPIQVPIVRLNEFLPDTQEIGRGVVVGQPGWPELLESKKVAFIAEFVLRPRFTTAFPGSMTPTEFVDKLNLNAGNPLSGSERQGLINDLTGGGKTRAQVLRAVAEDADLVAAETNRAFVLVQFFGYLRRNPNDPQDTDYTGYEFWLTKLNQFNGDFIAAEMVKAFLDSNEYKRRFGPD